MQKITLITILATLPFLGSCSQEAHSEELKIFHEPCNSTMSQVVATVGDKQITLENVVGEDRVEYYEAQDKLFEFKNSRLKEYITQMTIEEAAGSKDAAAVDKFVTEKIVGNKINISDKMVNDFAKERKIPQDKIDDRLKGRIKEYLAADKKREIIESFVANKLKNTKIVASECKPQRPKFEVTAGNSFVWGSPKAPVEIIEFSDFQCPFCARANNGAMEEVKKHYGKDKVKIVFKHFPLSFHQDAPKASEAALCAGDQNKFWEFHDKLFADNSKIKVEDLKALAKTLHLDETKFNTCLDSGAKSGTIQADTEYGMKGIKGVAVKSTPTFFVNGILVSGALPFDEFKKIIDEELKAKR